MNITTFIRACGLSGMTVSSLALASTPANSLHSPSAGLAGAVILTVVALSLISWQVRLFREILAS